MQTALTISQEKKDDDWAQIRHADLDMLRVTRARHVINRYRSALAGLPATAIAAVLRQVRLFTGLKLLAPLAKQVEIELACMAPAAAGPNQRYVTFSGHRVDEPERDRARFPDTPAAVKAALDAIEGERRDVRDRYPECTVIGVAGGKTVAICCFTNVATRWK